jgi:hypothetical protein
MYLPDINIFCEKMGRKIGIEELAAEETPKQQELIVEENDIVEEFLPCPEIVVLCRRGNPGINSVVAVMDNGKQLAVCSADIPRTAMKKAAEFLNSRGRRRNGVARFSAELVTEPVVVFSADGNVCMREFKLKLMGEEISGMVYREWWSVGEEHSGRATLKRLELGKEFSLESRRKLQKQYCLRLD